MKGTEWAKKKGWKANKRLDSKQLWRCKKNLLFSLVRRRERVVKATS